MEIRYKTTEIRYKMTWQDRKEAIHIGWPLMSLGWKFYVTGLPVACVIGLLLMFWEEGYHAQWPLTGPFPWHTLKSMLMDHLINLLTPLPFLAVTWYLSAIHTVQINSLRLITGSRLGVTKMKWNKVLEILDTGDYLCFRTSAPAVTIVPKSAFPNKEQADAFAERAWLYWGQATGREGPTLNPVGVWPPAPSPANSQEPGSRP